MERAAERGRDRRDGVGSERGDIRLESPWSPPSAPNEGVERHREGVRTRALPLPRSQLDHRRLTFHTRGVLELADDLLDHLAMIREHFIRCYRDAVEKALERTGHARGRVYVEASMSVEGEDDSVMFDLLEILDDGTYQPIHVLHPSFVKSADVVHPFEGATLTVGELVWFAASLTIQPAIDPAYLADWFVRWHSTGFEVEPPLGGRVHFVEVRVAEDEIELHLDLGSAPVEAMRDLIERSIDAGAKNLVLRSHPDDLTGEHPA